MPIFAFNKNTTLIAGIDIGNTLTKLAVFQDNKIILYDRFEKHLFREKILSLDKKTTFVLSQVSNYDEEIVWLKDNFDTFVIDKNQNFPFINKYQTPNTLGIDRMVLASGAVFNYPNTNCLVIDMGTCITYDYINNRNEYMGGAISPGLNMRFDALHQKTSNLPLIDFEDYNTNYGIDTKTSILHGVVGGIINEIEGFIKDFSELGENFTIILTGGDSIFFAKKLKSPIFAHPNFLLESLVQLYQYQKIE